jgi:GNAT superfamily N-acetyltransferase
MQIDFTLLADRPEALPIVARWYFDQWGRPGPWETLASTEESLANYLNRDRIPLMILAVENERVAGAAQLKLREMDIYPDKEHWLGGVFVAPEYRGRQIASRLAERIADVAGTLGVRRLHLQTLRFDGGLYAKLGWRPQERVTYKGREVLVMERPIVPQ